MGFAVPSSMIMATSMQREPVSGDVSGPREAMTHPSCKQQSVTNQGCEVILQGRPQAASYGVCLPQVMGGPCAVRARPGRQRTFEF